MKILKDSFLALVVVMLLGSAAAVTVSGQGRGRGGGQGNGGGPPSTSNAGWNRGISASDATSNARTSNGRDNASDKSKGSSDDHVRQVAKDRKMNGNELNRYRGIARRLNTTPEKMHSLYLTASKLNPNLTFGQFVAANTVANNLNSRYPGVTANSILLGLQNGRSIGQTLKSLRVEPGVADRAEKEAKQQIKGLM